MRYAMSSLLCALLALPLGAQQPAPPKKPAEPPKPAPGSLEDVVDQALRNSPEIHAAEAKVRSAEAELQKTRMEVLQKVTTLKFGLEGAKKTAELAKQYLAKQEELMPKGTASTFETKKAQLDYDRCQFEVERLQAELNTFLGRMPGKNLTSAFFFTNQCTSCHSNVSWHLAQSLYLDPRIHNRIDLGANLPAMHQPYFSSGHGQRDLLAAWIWKPEPAAAGSVSDRIRAALDQPLKLESSKEALPLAETLEMIRKKAGIDVPIRVVINNKQPLSVELMAGELPLGAWFQAVEDFVPEIAIAVREYGILVTLKERLPRDAELMRDFWRRARAEQSKAKDKPEPKK